MTATKTLTTFITVGKRSSPCWIFLTLSKFSHNSIFSKKVYEDNYFIADDYRNREDFNLKEIVEKYSIKKEDIIKVKKYCENINIDFAATPFSYEEADFLNDILNVNGFDERMQYGGEDRELGERMLNLGIRSKQLRYSAVCLHLDHTRGYVKQEMI